MQLVGSVGLAVVLTTLAGPAGAASPTALDTLIERTSRSIQVADSGLAGPGADWIRTRARLGQFVLLGEDHGIAGMAHFSAALAKTAGRVGYRYTAIEVDPLIGTELERLLRSSDPAALEHYLKQDGYRLAVPIYSMREEADFLRAALRNGPKDHATLWGLDQAFIGAAYAYLVKIESLTDDPAAKADAAELARDARADSLSFLGNVDQGRLLSLQSKLQGPKDAEARKLVEALVVSSRIYRPFVVRGSGSIYSANLEREKLMKRTFIEQYRAAQKRDGAPPKVLFKFGAYHMTNGLSGTHVPSLASFAYEKALGEGSSALSILMICGPGGASAGLLGNVASCDEDFAKYYGFLAPHVAESGATLIDLRPWRDTPRAWKDLSEDVKAYIWAYDAIVVISGGGESHAIVK